MIYAINKEGNLLAFTINDIVVDIYDSDLNHINHI
jgi:hypothetical protein